MKVTVRKPFLNHAKGEVIETTPEKAKHWESIGYVERYKHPKPVSSLLDDHGLPPRRTKEAKEILDKINKHYANQSKG